jgi:4-diphosphocytidyl-2-C-methyl-D-erythritol kinase
MADNLVLRAIAATRTAVAGTWPGAPAQPPALAARLDKRIPVTAGLGGGSSDAAAAIEGALEAWGATASDEERVRIAVSIGSDVPLFLARGPALIEGRGERVTRLHGVRCAAGEEPGVLLVTPALAVHTADVFAAWSAGAMAEPGVARRTSEHFASEFGSGLTGRQLLERAAVLASANDLAAAAAVVAPGLISFRRALTRLLSRPVGLSGSGPTLWVLYPSLAAAEEAASAVRSAVERRELDAPGAGPLFVAATPIAASQTDARTPGDDSSRRAHA